MSRTALPSESNCSTTFTWSVLSLRGRPKRTPRCLAASRPAPVRSRIRSRSNSAMPAKTVMIILPACVVVLAQGSDIDWNLPSASLIVSIVFSRSRVERANLSSFQTTMTAMMTMYHELKTPSVQCEDCGGRGIDPGSFYEPELRNGQRNARTASRRGGILRREQRREGLERPGRQSGKYPNGADQSCGYAPDSSARQ